MFVIKNDQIKVFSNERISSFRDLCFADISTKNESDKKFTSDEALLEFIERAISYAKSVHIRKEKNIQKVVNLLFKNGEKIEEIINPEEYRILHSSTTKEELKIKFVEDLFKYYFKQSNS